MPRYVPHLAALGLLAACTTAQQTQIQTAVTAGQLFCAEATAAGPIVVGIINSLDQTAVTVTNQTASYVAGVCAAINAVPVTPPAAPAQAPVVAVNVAAVPKS